MTFPFPYISPIRFVSSTLTYVTTVTDTVDASSFTFSSTSIGPAHSTRTVLLVIRYSSGSTLSLSSLTIGGNAAEVVVQRHGAVGGQIIAKLAVASGTTADIALTMSGTVTRIACSVYYTTLSPLLVLSRQRVAVTGPNLDVNVERIINGGFVLSGFNNTLQDTVTVSYTGTDTPVRDNTANLESALTTDATSILTTETTSDKTLSYSTGVTAGKGVALATFAEGYTQGTLVFVEAYGDAVSGTTYTFQNMGLENPSASRMIVVTGGWTAAASRTVSSVSIAGTSATIVQQISGTTGGSFIAYAAVASGYLGDIVVTMNNTCTSLDIGIYSTNPASTTPVDSGATSASTASVTVANIEVKNGGFLIVAARTSTTAAITASYNGVDTLTRNALIFLGPSDGEGFGTFSALTTENATTNDPGVSGAGSVGKQVCAASWL